jgi:two-component system, OmpR family, heavy metal sensor histidine kinase CusS
MSRRSIRFRLTVWYATVLTAGLSLFGGLIWLSLRQRLIGEIDRDLEGRASRFEQYFRTESAEGAGVQLRDELGEFCQALPPSSYVYLSGSNGFMFRFPPEASGAAPNLRMLGRQFTFQGETFDLEMGAAAGDVLHTLYLLRLLLLSLIPVVVAIACVGGAWLSGRALKPVHDLTAAAVTIGIENLSARLPVPPTGDELARLTEGWNTMLARLESAVKTLSQFVADASHELRTPLAVIRTTAELAVRRARSPEAYRESLQEIAGEAERMTQLVEDLLVLARADTGTVEMPLAPVDARQVVRGVCAELRGLAELRQVRIMEPLGEGAAMISGNHPALHRLFLVLLDNALKYSPAGADVNITVERTDSLVSVAIEDFGTGISEADLPHIFKRFYRADRARSGGGHGLGLSLAESIARTHGATIEVRRTERASTVFRVLFASRDTRPPLPPFSQSSASPATIDAAHAPTKGIQHT